MRYVELMANHDMDDENDVTFSGLFSIKCAFRFIIWLCSSATVENSSLKMRRTATIKIFISHFSQMPQMVCNVVHIEGY